MHRRSLVALVPLIAMMLGCGSKAAPSGAGGSGGAGSSLSFNTPPIALQPGEEVRYSCDTVTTPSTPTTVTAFRPTYGTGTHHLNVYQVLLGPETAGDAWDCPNIVKPTWVPLYVAGTTPAPLVFPAGYGLTLPANTELVIQRHLLDTSSAAESATATVEMDTTEAPVAQAGGFGFESTMFSIPANAQGYVVTTTCAAPEAMHFFAGFGHAHRFATSVDLAVNGKPVFHEPWNFDDQVRVATDFDVAQGDTLTLTCTYNNTTPNPISYGESTLTEMCAWFGHEYPYHGHFRGCIDGAPVSF